MAEAILPRDFTGSDVGAFLTTAFMESEAGDLAPGEPRPLRMAGLGTVAHRVLASASFGTAMAGIEFSVLEPHADPVELVNDRLWDVALVFSPFKQTVAGLLAKLAPTAQRTGGVDTALRAGGMLHGFNTTSWAAQVVLEQLCSGRAPEQVLVLGSGPSTHSVVAAIQRSWGDATDVVVAARTPSSLRSAPGIRVVNRETAAQERPPLIVNCTTWGETAESEETPFALPFAELLRPNVRFLDLNNRVSLMQQQALAAGAQVMSGIAVRDANNLCRAALAARLEGR